jgi:hypothetical protein
VRAAPHAAGWPPPTVPSKPVSGRSLGDDLFANQPICEAVRAACGHFLFVCKPASHPLIQEHLTGAELPTNTPRVKRGREWFAHRFRRMVQVPLRDGKDAMTVNWLEIEIRNPAGQINYRNSFVTDLPVEGGTVAELAACGRARWKIENETYVSAMIADGNWLGDPDQMRRQAIGAP